MPRLALMNKEENNERKDFNRHMFPNRVTGSNFFRSYLGQLGRISGHPRVADKLKERLPTLDQSLMTVKKDIKRLSQQQFTLIYVRNLANFVKVEAMVRSAEETHPEIFAKQAEPNIGKLLQGLSNEELINQSESIIPGIASTRNALDSPLIPQLPANQKKALVIGIRKGFEGSHHQD
ncbi:uncharacterized protein ATNIH1004_011467 [Aspergillus tanneri]|uniref:Uncharacterized protein n=1 Tax=Aspergillus tanneri TaxID=1220188 RepID=A0A5M9M633_9EURO|nr:uncharacterized protein ATNIH1004_011467 [Aspergillus tanneri]KAA8642522.1 hypothetical protein ATNIH1004_011467 [Aspergillus tanneri]